MRFLNRQSHARRNALGTLAGGFSMPNFSKGVGTSSTSRTTSGNPDTVATLIGYKNTSQMSMGANYKPVYMYNPAPQAPVTNNTTVIQTPVNVSAPITTQTTTAVSPSMNVAAGNQGGSTSQGASTAQQATPSSDNRTPQGSTTGLSEQQIAAMLEQQRRESDTMNAERITSAQREADLRGQLATQQAIAAMQKEYAEKEAIKRAQPQTQPLAMQQEYPISAPVNNQVLVPQAAMATTAPVPAPVTVPLQTGQTVISSVKPAYLLAALVLGALLLSQGGKDGKYKSSRK